MLIGVIADDFTGASDIASMLATEGMRTTQYVGVPDTPAAADVEAGVVALKSRTIPRDDAVSLSLAALEWLDAQGCRQFVFKYCSTFDSTADGNIGPVAEALAERLGEDKVVVCPASPANGRTVFQGHLFVADRLLSESGMRDHPLTPMRDPDLRRVLAAQTTWPVGHIAFDTVSAGAPDITAAFDTEGREMLIVDAVRDADLRSIGRACTERQLITGASGIACGLPANFGKTPRPVEWTGEPGPAVILSGSCSVATRQQVKMFSRGNPGYEVDVEAVMSGAVAADVIADWVFAQEVPSLVYSSAEPAAVKAAQDDHGAEKVAERIEGLFAELARNLVSRGVTRLVCAGGETSGAIVEGLELASLQIGPEIAPGVPAVRADRENLVLALKSGNFGDSEFFTTALETLADE